MNRISIAGALALLSLAVLGLSGFLGGYAFAQDRPSDTLLITSQVSIEGQVACTQIFRITGDGLTRTPITSGSSFDADPALSPDGKQIVFVAPTQADPKIQGLYVMNSDGSDRKRLVAGVGGDCVMSPNWSPDGKRIIFGTIQLDHKRLFTNPCIYIMDADGRRPERLGKVAGLLPVWSPSGKQILFTGWSSDTFSLCAMDPDGGNVRTLVKDGALMGSWSPDGQSIAYLQITPGARPPCCLFVARADGSNPKRVVCGPDEIALGPKWSHNGKQLFFTQRVGGRVAAVHVIGSDGENLRCLSKDNNPEWLGNAFLAQVLGSAARPPAESSPDLGRPPNLVIDRRDQKAVKRIQSIGGSVVQTEGKATVAAVDLSGTRVTDADLECLVELKELESLNLSGTAVSNAGLKWLSGLQNLQRLDLSNTGITNPGAKDLAALLHLAELDLKDVSVTDAGLKDLAVCKNLRRLNLQGSKVTDAGLKELARFPKLACLDLFETQVSDATLRTLRESDRLHLLFVAEGKSGERPNSLEAVIGINLAHTKVTDAGLKELAGMKNLAWISLEGTHVTDAGLKTLAHHKNLTRIDLQGISGKDLTDAGVAQFRKERPNCMINR